MKVGIILDLQASWTSGLAILVLQDPQTGKIKYVPCDNGPTVRALADLFADDEVIGPGHTVNVDALRGREIAWDWDDLGLTLGYIAPPDMAEDAT